MMAMCQHFLLSAKARTLSLKAIYKGGEDKAYQTFKRLRWPETEARNSFNRNARSSLR